MSVDARVFLGCCVVSVFFAGLAIGQQHPPAVCPVVAGQTVVSTIDSRDGQICVYANSYGRATRRVRL
jgi:hypothetical protein